MREIYHMTSTFQKIVQDLETEEDAIAVRETGFMPEMSLKAPEEQS